MIKRARPLWLWDICFCALAAGFAWAALSGVQELSGGGAVLDSDLCTYAQAMAGLRHPELFANDWVLKSATPSGSIWNLQRYFAELLTPGENYALGLLRAGAGAIFVFYVGFYLLGRWLFRSPALAFLLALLMGITVWVGWGTFWGVTHSDPVPRIFFGALYPLLLFGAIAALERPWLRIWTMLAVGLCMWVHGVSTLNVGPMFFVAFALHRPQSLSWRGHIGNLLLCLLLYCLPVLTFLWPALFQGKAFSPADMDVLQQIFHIRWAGDYFKLWGRFVLIFTHNNLYLYTMLGGILSWLYVRRHGGPRIRALASMYPGFMLGLCGVLLSSWVEAQVAPALGRLPLAHEFVRGMRFLVPLSWLMVVGCIACFWPRLCVVFRVVLVLGTMLAIGIFNQDRQFLAAIHSTARLLDIAPPARTEALLRKVKPYREALDALGRLVPQGEAVFSNGEDMAVRYLLLQPLVYTFKDGYIFYYNRDVDNSRLWMRYNTLMGSGPLGYIEAWKLSGAPWLLSSRPEDKALLEARGDVLWESPGWLVVRRR